MTSRTCKDVTEREAADAILGYTIGNDLSCRLFQMPKQGGGQFFYAKAFDNFAPIGPALVSADAFPLSEVRMTLKVNGEKRQEADFEKDMVFSPAAILSFMSQGAWVLYVYPYSGPLFLRRELLRVSGFCLSRKWLMCRRQAPRSRLLQPS